MRPRAEGESKDDYSERMWFQNERFDEMWLEFLNHVIGPMPVDDFLQRFLRLRAPNLPAISYEGLETLLEMEEKRPRLYTEFIDVFQPICPDLTFKDTHSRPVDTHMSLRIQPDICVFKKDISENDTCDPEIMITLKPSTNSDDLFDDRDAPTEMYFSEEIEATARVIGRVTAYAAAHQVSQFRTHVYSVLVLPTHAILFRWDRSGVVVTEPFPVSSPYLLEFFHLYNYATPHARGIDLSVTTPSLKDASNARAALGIPTSTPLEQLSVGSSDSSYILCDVLYVNCRFPFGRSTRAFVAYSVSCGAKVFLKDTWRLDSKTPEHRIYDHLHRNNVPHIPTVINGGDILDHTTLTQDLIEEDPAWIRKPSIRLNKYRHYRLVLREIATPLRSFPSTKVLVTAIRDAMEAHRVAYFEAGVLHRDISPNNIMIYNDGGLLLDWDSSISTHDKGSQESKRTGTWQFMSVMLLKKPEELQDRLDDVESFVHVLTWISFRFARTNLKPGALSVFIATVFDYSFGFVDALGGGYKSGHLHNPSELSEAKFESTNLQNLLLKITEIMEARYRSAPDLDDLDDLDDLGNAARLKVLLHNHWKTELAKLEDPMLMISEFTLALSLPDWPTGDVAVKNKITPVVIRRSRSPIFRKFSQHANLGV